MSTQTVTAQTTADVRVGDRITVNPGALSARTYRPLTRGFSIEVTYARRDHAGRVHVEGHLLTARGELSESQTAHRSAEIGGPADGEWTWFGPAPAARTREALAAELGQAYGVDPAEARAAVDGFARRLETHDARVEFDRVLNPGRGDAPAELWQSSRGEPTELGAEHVREVFGQGFAQHVRDHVTAAMPAGALRTVQPGATMTVADPAGRRWFINVGPYLTHAHGVFLPGEKSARSLLSATFPNGIDLPHEVDQAARAHLRDDAAEALFLSLLQPSQNPSNNQVMQAISDTVAEFGCDGCAACVAAEFGDHPETAAQRMIWCRTRIAQL